MTITDDAAVDDGGPARAPAPTEEGPPAQVTLTIWRGDPEGGEFTDYVMPAVEGEVVLDVIHRIQATEAPDLACRWNCKAGKCGSCSAEINGTPRLMCMTRMDALPEGAPVTVAPMKTFPIIRDLVTDVSFNYEVAKTVPAFHPGPEPEGGYRMAQVDVERGQEFRKCIECFMCQDVCHVIRDHEDNKPKYAGPRFFIRFAELEMHPLDTNDRRELARSGPGHVQHHQVLHRGVPRAHQDHRQRHHPHEGAGGRCPLRPGGVVGPEDPQALQEDCGRGVRRLSRRTLLRLPGHSDARSLGHAALPLA
jgi:succinate dehydrogenase / fumarate reductase iron-sulfur subunit